MVTQTLVNQVTSDSEASRSHVACGPSLKEALTVSSDFDINNPDLSMMMKASFFKSNRRSIVCYLHQVTSVASASFRRFYCDARNVGSSETSAPNKIQPCVSIRISLILPFANTSAMHRYWLHTVELIVVVKSFITRTTSHSCMQAFISI